MKEGWEKKKLSEVAEIIGGSTPKTNVQEYWGGTNYWVTPAELSGEKYIEKTERTITDLAVKKTNLQLLPPGTVLLSSRAPIGKTAITTVPMYCNQGFKNIVCSESLCNSFVYWYLSYNKDFLNELGTGATFKEISKKTVSNIEIPVPPLSVQESIVSELDMLSGIISKHKALQEEYDRLEQSIFYDMFGDPINNNKGWEVKKLGEVAEIIGGSTPKTNIPEFWGGTNYWITPAELSEEKYIGKTERTITDLAVKKTNLQLLPIGTVLLSSRAPIGKVAITTEPMYCNQGFKNIVCSEILCNTFICWYLFYNKDYLNELGTGATFKEISKKTVSNIKIILPPLSLQQSFADKISAIEQMKAKNKAAQEEAEMLFNERMAYYF